MLMHAGGSYKQEFVQLRISGQKGEVEKIKD
jgi:hypothetical protein